MKGKYYSTGKLIVVCFIALGVTACALAFSVNLGYGEIAVVSTIIGAIFLCVVVLMFIREAAKVSAPNKEVKEAEEETIAEEYDGVETDPNAYQPELPEKITEGLPYDESGNAQNEIKEMTEVSISREIMFSLQDLVDSYNLDTGLTLEERTSILDKFKDCRKKLDLTEQARHEVANLKKDTAILRDSYEMTAYFCLYDNQYVVPTLKYYMDWDKRRLSEIEDELGIRMMEYMFTYTYEKTDRNIRIASLYPAIVTKNADGEYIIEESNKGKLFFKSLN